MKNKRKYQLKPSAIRQLYSRFRGYLVIERKPLLQAVACMLGVAAVEILAPWPMKVIFDAILIPTGSPDAVIRTVSGIFGVGQGLLYAACLSILALAIAGGAFSFGQAVLLSGVGQRVVAAVRFDLYKHIQSLSQSFHDSASSGDLLARLTGDVRMVRDLLVTSVIFLSARIIVIAGTLTVMALMDWRLMLVSVAILPALIICTFMFAERIRSAARSQRRKESKIAHVMAENLSAMRLIQAYGREDHESERFQTENASSAGAEFRASRLEASLDRIVQVILAFGMCAVLWFGVARVRSGVLTPGDLLVFVAYLRGFYKPIRKLAAMTGRISKATACGERILAILDRKPDIVDEPDAIQASDIKGRIEFRSVSFGYFEGHDVIRNATLSIQAGETVALVSRSGSGKSTIAQLLLRFYRPSAGTIAIDGVDISNYRIAELRERFAILLQDSVLFNASIRDNIAYGKLDASEDEILAAARAANAEEFILDLPDGFDTVVGARGATLSGGQRQRIAIARAMIRDASIVILDEPMTGLDPSSEAAVCEALERLIRGRTCIIITHDHAAAGLADRLLEIQDRAIVEISRSHGAGRSNRHLETM